MISSPAQLRLRRISTLEELEVSWVALADAQSNVFSTWEWAAAWWRVYGAGRELFLHQVLDQSGSVVGILPLYLAGRRFPQLVRFIGHGPADALGPVCAAEDRFQVGCALRALLNRMGMTTVLLGEQMRIDDGWATILRGAPLRYGSYPLIDLDGLTWDEWLARKSANFRQQPAVAGCACG